MLDPSSLRTAFQIQAQACEALGSPFSARLLSHAAEATLGETPLAALLAPWAEATTRALVTDAVPLRWLGAMHDRVLSGEAPDLAAAYPGEDRTGDPDDAWRAAEAAMAAAPVPFAAFMAHEPQTNEVRRSAALLGGFLTVAAETGLPLRLFEIGASAGLNQLWDQFHYDFGKAGQWGNAASTVRLDAEWRGAPPPDVPSVTVRSRGGCDRKPVDLHDPLARRRLRAYVWADQRERLNRLDAAIAAALAAQVTLDTEDAVTWTDRRVAPAAGMATVLFHSVFWQYMPAESQARLAATIAGIGGRADAGSPFAWLRMEPAPDNMAVMEVRLTLWPGGEARRLAVVHPHGAWVEWGEPSKRT